MKRIRLNHNAARYVSLAFSERRPCGRCNGKYYTNGTNLYLGFIEIACWTDNGTLKVFPYFGNESVSSFKREYINIVLKIFYPCKKPPRFSKRKNETWLLFNDPKESIIHIDNIRKMEFTDKENYFIPDFGEVK